MQFGFLFSIVLWSFQKSLLADGNNQWPGCLNLELKFEKLEKVLNRHTETLKQIDRQVSANRDVTVKNIAYGKVTQQSSTAGPFAASLAIDANKDTTAITEIQYHPYWVIDLEKTYTIQRIEIFNRRECCGERLHDLEITVGSSVNDMSFCTHYKGPSRSGEHLVFTCRQEMSGRFVRLKLLGTEYLQLAEVQVYAPIKYGL